MTACASILCDNCKAPGHCCSGFSLGGGTFAGGKTMLEALVESATIFHGIRWGDPVALNEGVSGAEHVQTGLPFMPLFREKGGAWRWWCPTLGLDGRCSDYDNRPALCRSYKAGSDGLCAMHCKPALDEGAMLKVAA